MVLLMHNASNVRWWERGDGYVSLSWHLESSLRLGCICMQWPGVQGLQDPPHAQLPLFGGAAFERCMSEFQTAVTSLSFPSGKPFPASIRSGFRPRS